MRQIGIHKSSRYCILSTFYECIAKRDPLESACRLSRARLIIRIKCSSQYPSAIMLVAEPYSELFADAALPNLELLEVHRSKISLHHAKVGYSYPMIRLPHTLSTLSGLPTRIYQTVHDGALAFLVVISKGAAKESSPDLSEKAGIDAKMSALTWRRSPVRIRPSPSYLPFKSGIWGLSQMLSSVRSIGDSPRRIASTCFLRSWLVFHFTEILSRRPFIDPPPFLSKRRNNCGTTCKS